MTTTMKSIEKKMANVLTEAAGTKVTAEFVNVNGGYFFIEWEGNDKKAEDAIQKCFNGKAKDFDYDDEFNFSSCYVEI